MGKKSRKGKKAWRKLSSQDIDDFQEKSTKDALSGGSLTSVPSDSLFYVDKSTDLPVKRKTEKYREKVLRHESILKKNPFVQAIPSSITKKKTKKSEGVEHTSQPDLNSKEEGEEDTGVIDIWEDQGDDKKKRKKGKLSVIPAVEIEPPGCSFNPESESHKDSLAHAVADEMSKIYRSELGPQPVPLIVPGEPIDEETRYFIDADGGSEDEMEESPAENGDSTLEKISSKTKRVTRVELNRRVRRKEQLRAEEESKKIEQLSKDIDSIPDIIQEIAKEEEEKGKRHLRRIVAKKERLKSFPPRLGKRKFEPAPMQVLLSEEITGSLRKLKGCPTLARDRYKSLEKRGLIVPSAKKSRRYG